MDSVNVLKALERERELLEDFICLSEEQLLVLEDENIDAVNSLLKRRADLMVEMTAIEATLGTWISQIRTEPSVTPQMMRELRAVNNEIVSMANHIIEIDEQTWAIHGYIAYEGDVIAATFASANDAWAGLARLQEIEGHHPA